MTLYNSAEQPNTQHKESPFRLAPIQSPEEEARDQVLRELAPVVRRRVREDDRLSPGAKYFFNCLFDDCFWRQIGGYGTGQVFADIRTLAERYRADEKTICRWRDELVDARWLWTNYEWPMTEWRLTPLLPAPSTSPQKRAVQMSLGRASSVVGEMPTTPRNGANGHSAGLSGKSPPESGQNGGRETPKCPSPVGKMPDGRGHSGGEVVGKMPTGDRQNAHGPPPKCPRATGKMPTGDRKKAHGQKASRPASRQKNARLSASTARREKVSGEGRKEQSGGEGQNSPPQRQEWEAQLKKLFPRELESMRRALTTQRRGLSADDPLAADLDRRLAAIDTAQYGGPMAANNSKPQAQQTPQIEKPLTEAELLEGARYCVTLGLSHLLTEGQRAALKRAGEPL